MVRTFPEAERQITSDKGSIPVKESSEGKKVGLVSGTRIILPLKQASSHTPLMTVVQAVIAQGKESKIATYPEKIVAHDTFPEKSGHANADVMLVMMLADLAKCVREVWGRDWANTPYGDEEFLVMMIAEYGESLGIQVQ